jgi:hypothetical protein
VINMKIIFAKPDGGVAIIHPTGELPVEDVARKDVPQGVPYKFISEADIPTDRTFRNAWEADFSAPDGYGLGHDAWVAQKAAEAPEQPELDLEQPE